MVRLLLLLWATKHADDVGSSRPRYHNLLESTLKRHIFLDMFFVLVESGSTDAAELTPAQQSNNPRAFFQPSTK